MRHLLTALALLAASGVVPAMAEDPVSPSEFRDYAEGWTLHFERDGEPYGSERFGEGGKARWRSPEGICARGVWRAQEGKYCFLYDAMPEVTCWEVLRDEEGLLVRLVSGGEPGLELRVVGRDKAPLLCGGPGAST